MLIDNKSFCLTNVPLDECHWFDRCLVSRPSAIRLCLLWYYLHCLQQIIAIMWAHQLVLSCYDGCRCGRCRADQSLFFSLATSPSPPVTSSNLLVVCCCYDLTSLRRWCHCRGRSRRRRCYWCYRFDGSYCHSFHNKIE